MENLAAPTTPRRGFPLFELARVTGGTITRVHFNWCPSLDNAGRCTCTTVDYRVVKAGGPRQ